MEPREVLCKDADCDARDTEVCRGRANAGLATKVDARLGARLDAIRRALVVARQMDVRGMGVFLSVRPTIKRRCCK
jgi:hypothetical protein